MMYAVEANKNVMDKSRFADIILSRIKRFKIKQ